MKKHSYSYDELIASGNGKMFGPEDGRLPLPPMLMMDRITRINDDGGPHGKGEIIAELDIKPDLWFFDCHFQGDPVMPGCLGLDAMWQLIGFFLLCAGGAGRGRALGCGEVKFSGEVLPTAKKLTYRIDMRRVIIRRLIMGVADATLEVDGRVIYTATNLKVGLFKNTSKF